MNKDAQMRATINQKLIETGERERLKELLRAKLIECGWKDQLKAHCKAGACFALFLVTSHSRHQGECIFMGALALHQGQTMTTGFVIL
ncbi:transcription and mRNA export factor ENY2 isoform X2 [Agelaius tricolor]|uniref:transcription and mRNA export factor ENY2 isoform X2 n=1 Tax=Agelaius phoeniceus TaxID=39638 RepID=UPI0039F20514